MKGRRVLACQWGRVCTFYLWTSLKGDSPGLAWKTTAAGGVGVKADGSAETTRYMCSCTCAWKSVCVYACVCTRSSASFMDLFWVWSVHTLLVAVLVAELFIMQWPLTPLTLLVNNERHPFLWWGLRGARHSLSVIPCGLGISIDNWRAKHFSFVCFN